MITAHQKKEKSTALVAGGAGFLGSFLCEALLLQGCQVICLDDLSTGKKENLKKCLSSSNFVFFQHDLRNPWSQAILNYLQNLENQNLFIFNLTSLRQVTERLLALAKKTGGKFLEVRGLERKEQFSFDEVNARVVYVADVYGPRMSFNDKNFLVQLIKASVFNHPLKIFGTGDKAIYPVFVSDVIYGITKAMFADAEKGESFYLINQEKILLLDLAHQLQKLSQQELKIEFIADENKKNGYPIEEASRLQKKLNWRPKIDLKEGLKETLNFFKKDLLKNITPLESYSRPHRRLFYYWSAIFLIFFLLPWLILFFNGFWGWFNFKNAQQSFEQANFVQSGRQSQRAKLSFENAQKNVLILEPIFSFLGQQKLAETTSESFYLAKAAAQGLNSLGEAIKKIDELVKVVFQNKPGDAEELTNTVLKELDDGYRQLSLVEADLKNIKAFFLTDKVVLVLPEIRRLILQAKQAIQLAPEITGVNGKKIYLVLLQNNSELRPTGGFIGSFGLIEFENGRLAGFEVRDVYSADGQLKGHVEPPFELKKYLGEAGWFLRDSNWDPNFPSSAKRAAWFLEKETGQLVDGVIGINLFLIQETLRTIGEIEMPDYGEKINADNLFEKAEYYSETGFFPGSTQKQDFLGNLSRVLFERLKNLDTKTGLEIFKKVYLSLNKKDVMVYLNNFQVMRIVSEMNWDGRVNNDSLGQGYPDYLFLVESNVGVNKANFFVKRNLVHQVNFLTEGKIKKKLLINYQNNAQSEIFPAGTYRNYLRILTPLGSQLEKVVINGEEVENDKIGQTTLHHKTSFGFLVEVPVGDSRLVEVIYFLPEKMDLNEQIDYLLLFQKQSGIQDEQVMFDLIAPQGVSILPETSFKTAFDKDLLIKATLVR